MAEYYVLVLLAGLLTGLLEMISSTSTNTSSRLLEYKYVEEQPSGTIIGNVRWDFGIPTKYTPKESALLRFAFRSNGGPYRYFVINNTTGVIRSSQVIDRESFARCSNSVVCEFRLDIAVQPLAYFQIIKVVVNLVDINDNSPTFPDSRISLEIIESTIPGSRFFIPPAVDADTGTFGVQNYSLRTKSDVFEVETVRHNDNTISAFLKLKTLVDRETQDLYFVEVLARDGGIPLNEDSLNISITITDANDNSPVFTNTSYFVELLEDLPSGSSILKVEAFDADLGDNGEVLYHFSEYTSSFYGHLFNIDNVSGVICTKQRLQDYHFDSIILLTIVAQDKGLNPRLSYTQVSVHILDISNDSPHITVDSSHVEVQENCFIGSFVAHITIKDDDEGPAGTVSCSTDSDFFHLDWHYVDEYTLKTSVEFDREVQDSYSVNITCVDNGVPPQFDTMLLDVLIIDENDNDPQIPSKFVTHMSENNAINDIIIQLNATDKDIGKNADLTFELEKSAQRIVAVDPKSGLIIAKVIFDYELVQQYVFEIVVKDQGVPQRTSSTVLVVNIHDQNDEVPSFAKSSYYFNVLENQPSGTSVGVVHAEDADLDPAYSKVIYSIRPRNHLFTIDEHSGIIETLRALDREEQTQFRLTVVATSAALPMFETTTIVLVYVIDENDNPPKIHHLTDPYISVLCKIPPGQVISRIEAVDPDEGKNKILRYFIVSGNEDGIFVIDSQVGAIFVSGAHHESISNCRTHILTVEVRDGGEPTQMASTDIIITLKNSTDPIGLPYLDGTPSPVVSESWTAMIIGMIVGTVCIISIITAVALACHFQRKRRIQMEIKKLKELEMELLDAEPDVLIEQVPNSENGFLRAFIRPSDDSEDSGCSDSEDRIKLSDESGYFCDTSGVKSPNTTTSTMSVQSLQHPVQSLGIIQSPYHEIEVEPMSSAQYDTPPQNELTSTEVKPQPVGSSGVNHITPLPQHRGKGVMVFNGVLKGPGHSAVIQPTGHSPLHGQAALACIDGTPGPVVESEPQSPGSIPVLQGQAAVGSRDMMSLVSLRPIPLPV